MDTTLIREYNVGDKESCLNCFISNVPPYFTEDEISEFEDFLDKIGQLTPDNNPIKTHYFVIIDDDVIIGCGGFGDKDGKAAITFAWGLIDQNFHKKGFGQELLQFRIQKIGQLYPEFPIVLDTTQYSYSFFEKFGFKTISITDDYYSEGLHRYDMVFKTA